LVATINPSRAQNKTDRSSVTNISYSSTINASPSNLNPETNVWLVDGDFEKPTFDTGNIQDQCYTDAPWGSGSWGIEGSSFKDSSGQPPPGYIIDWSHFANYSGHNVYLYGKDESSYWSFVRYVQGDAWGGTNCSPSAIPWNTPAPLDTYGKDLFIALDLYRDTSELLIFGDSWLMFAINAWFESPELTDAKIVMDLALYHDCNIAGCGLESNFEENPDGPDIYRYQAQIGQADYQQWQAWWIDFSYHIQEALDYFNIEYAADTLQLQQLELVIEVYNSEGAATIDNFFLKDETLPTPTPTSTSTPIPTRTNTPTKTPTQTSTITQTPTKTPI